jgi:hypothetical protein
MEVVVKGAQDVLLTGNPDKSPFRHLYKRSSPFALCDYKSYFINGNLTLFKRGDLLSKCYLMLEDFKGKTVVPASWSGLFDTVDLYIGGQLIDSQDYTYSSVIWPALESDNLSHGVAPGTFYPLRFFFCNSWSSALPIAGIKCHDVEFRITKPSPNYKFVLWHTFINLGDEERALIPSEIVITQVQRVLMAKKTNYSELIGPVKYLASCPTLSVIYQPTQTYFNSINKTQTLTLTSSLGTGGVWKFVGLPSGVTQVGTSSTLRIEIGPGFASTAVTASLPGAAPITFNLKNNISTTNLVNDAVCNSYEGWNLIGTVYFWWGGGDAGVYPVVNDSLYTSSTDTWNVTFPYTATGGRAIPPLNTNGPIPTDGVRYGWTVAGLTTGTGGPVLLVIDVLNKTLTEVAISGPLSTAFTESYDSKYLNGLIYISSLKKIYSLNPTTGVSVLLNTIVGTTAITIIGGMVFDRNLNMLIGDALGQGTRYMYIIPPPYTDTITPLTTAYTFPSGITQMSMDLTNNVIYITNMQTPGSAGLQYISGTGTNWGTQTYPINRSGGGYNGFPYFTNGILYFTINNLGLYAAT